MYKERGGLPLWTRLTSIAVISALITGCVQKTMGYVTPTPEGTTTPVTEPYCDSHMLTIEPSFDMNKIDPQNLPILVENLMGPSGVGEIKGISVVKNPTKEYVSNVVRSVQEHQDQVEGIIPSQAQVVEFGMEGTTSESCAPLVMVLGEKNEDGTQKSYLGFGVEQIDADNDGIDDLEVLIPPFDGNIDRFLKMGQIDTNPNDSLVHIGPIDQLDPESIQPVFEIDVATGKVVFIPPFYQGIVDNKVVEVATELGGNFIETSFKIDGQNVDDPLVSSTPNPTLITPSPTATNEATVTPEIVQFKQCDVLDFLNCPITESQIPDYWKWVNETYAKNFTFDPSKFNNNVTLFESLGVAGSGFGKKGDVILYWNFDNPLGVKFPNADSMPFKRNFTAAAVKTLESDGKLHDTILLPIVFYNSREPSKNLLVMASYTFFTPGRPDFTYEQEMSELDILVNWMHYTPLTATYTTPYSPFNIELSLLKKVWQNVPDIDERMLRVTNSNSDDPNSQDISALSDPRIVVGTYISKSPILK